MTPHEWSIFVAGVGVGFALFTIVWAAYIYGKEVGRIDSTFNGDKR